MMTIHAWRVASINKSLAFAHRWTKETTSRLQQAQKAALENAQAGKGGHLRVQLLPKAGHWLHVDNPHGLMDMMLPSFVNPDIT